MQRIEQLIAQAPVFAGMATPQLEVIAGCARNEHMDTGTLLLREGAAADRFFLLRRGRVSLELRSPNDAPLVIETLHEGDVVGWSWLFAPYRWPHDARAVVPCEVVSFDGACLRGKSEADHELGYELLRRFAATLVETLAATQLQLLDVYGHARALA